MRYAVISAENETFETDSGVDPMGIARALVNMAKGGETQSGSTITQQYVKNTMLDQSQTVTRKFKEMLISIKVGAKVSKNDILTGYLNTSYYGRGAYGIQAAAQTYYGVDAENLNPASAPFLAALLNGPTSTTRTATVASTRRRPPRRTPHGPSSAGRWILDQRGHVRPHDGGRAGQVHEVPDAAGPQGRSTSMTGQIGYLVDLGEQLRRTALQARRSPRQDLDRGGYQIYTTFKKDKVTS